MVGSSALPTTRRRRWRADAGWARGTAQWTRGHVRQRTLKESIQATGIGLHSGDKVYMTLRPAPVNTGHRVPAARFAGAGDVPASALNVTETMLGTTLERDHAKVGTVEHLMSAIAGLGIDNAFVDLTAAEVPIMDGSAAPFVFLLASAGIEEQSAPEALRAGAQASRGSRGRQMGAPRPARRL